MQERIVECLEKEEETPNIEYDPPSNKFLTKYFPHSTQFDWNNWQWQIKNSITTVEQLKKFVDVDDVQEGLTLPFRITPYYLSTMIDDVYCAQLLRTVVPSSSELIFSDGESTDPLGEHGDSPCKSIVHRYPDRVLFLVTDFCSTNCRYCTRSRMINKDGVSMENITDGLKYIREHTEVRDVLVSGGDVLTMPDKTIEFLLSELRSIKHVEFIRIGTKVPVVLPQRITDGLIDILKKYRCWISIHFTHPGEITQEVMDACNALADAGCPLGSQTVLLKGVNDDVETMKKLFHKLLTIRVRPYYLYNLDRIIGSKHFATAIEQGLDIIRGLRGYTSGYAVPMYVVDAAGGGGKIPIMPEYVVGEEDGYMLLKNYEGKTFKCKNG